MPRHPYARSSNTYGRHTAVVGSTLLVVLGTGAVLSKPLLTQDEDKGAKDALGEASARPSFSFTRSAHYKWLPSAGGHGGRRPSEVSVSTQTSGDTAFEDAGEGSDRAWGSRASSWSNLRAATSRRGSIGVPELATIFDNSPFNPTVPFVDDLGSPEISYGYARGSPGRDQEREGFVEDEKEDEDDSMDEDKRGTNLSRRPHCRTSWHDRFSKFAEEIRVEPTVDANPIDIDLDFLNLGSSEPSSYIPPARMPTIYYFAEITDAPITRRRSPPDDSPHADSSARSATPSLSLTPSVSSSLPLPSTPHLSQVPSASDSYPASPAPSSTATLSLPPGAAIRRSTSPSSLDPGPFPPLDRRISDDVVASRRLSSGVASSKSTNRLSAILTGGFGFGRSRTNTSSSAEANDGVRRRRTGSDSVPSPHSAPLSSVPSFSSLARSESPQPLRSHSPSLRRAPPPPPARPPPSAFAISPLSRSPDASRTWRSTTDDRTYSRLLTSYGEVEMRRQEVIWELGETERMFVESINGVMQLFTVPLRSQTGTWVKNVPPPVLRLLEWLDEIIVLHAQMLRALQRIQEQQSPVVTHFADSLLPFVSRLEVYQPYLIRFEIVTNLIDELVANPLDRFGEFVRVQSGRPECGGLSLASFLLKPVQRLMKFPLFFKQLCDLTPRDHPDFGATLVLYQSTDSMIRALQEVKAREDEYEELKVLETRLRGLPEKFKLAKRDRKLVMQGLLKQVHVSERDRAVLKMDARARAKAQAVRDQQSLRPNGAQGPRLRTSLPPPPLHSPRDNSRPISTVSADSSSSSVSASSSAAATWISDASSNGWISPATSSAVNGDLRGGWKRRPTSMVSTASSAWSEDWRSPPHPSDSHSHTGTIKPYKRPSSPPSYFPSPAMATTRLLKTRAKESTIQVFVFSDVVVLATPKRDDLSKMLKGSRMSYREGGDKASFKVLEGFGVARVLGVSDFSGKTEHESLVELDLAPVLEDAARLVPGSTTTSIFLTLPPNSTPSPGSSAFASASRPSSAHGTPSLSSPSAAHLDRPRWLRAFSCPLEFALQQSLASPLNGCTTPITQAERHFASTAPSTSSSRGREGAETEREWWTQRLRRVRKEMVAEGRFVTPETVSPEWALARLPPSSLASTRTGAGFQAGRVPEAGVADGHGLGIDASAYSFGGGRRTA
ncbi:rho guanyl-nucleotide exchange factor [Rhodotorula toruloides]|uniref:Rho guanyl-nucleotide exchange factor n=1 Tax=Rhodotorula toruloides TaxID=5286 RepID=A0A511KKF4_RHOTO|nr:rho guanyl-nucleotide exchange factor [Rhodotorula toruloides]